MPRTGVEEKLPWRLVPIVVRHCVQEIMGSSVVQGNRVWGGYGPTPTFRLMLADGQRVFFKGTHGGSNEFAHRALASEERIYQELSEVISPWAPRFYAAFRRDDWHVLLLEDVGPQTVPPWTPETTRRVAHALAGFHRSTLGKEDLPQWLPHPYTALPRVTWCRVAAESDDLRKVAELAQEHTAEALQWLQASLPRLSQLADTAAECPGPYALLHGDTRSDNLRFIGGRLALFDWPSAEIGCPEFDVVPFAQSVTVEGGVHPEQVIAWYCERLTLRTDALDCAVAWLAAYFADLAWRENIPGLPRLRMFQRRQLSIVLPWAAQRLHLPEPFWVSGIR